ncbi:unnamed protein product, partial [Prorocentrum cordatum]
MGQRSGLEGYESEGRERWAEVQGRVSGIHEEVQALQRRVESLDGRVCRAGSGDAHRQRQRELEQQVQSLEQQSSLKLNMADETVKRQAAKLARADESIREIGRRLCRVEEEQQQLAQQSRRNADTAGLESRMAQSERQMAQLLAEMQGLQLQVDQAAEVPSLPGSMSVDEAVEAARSCAAAAERKCMGQVEELASAMARLGVRSDSCQQRLDALAERLEVAHEPSLEALRSELAKARSQER